MSFRVFFASRGCPRAGTAADEVHSRHRRIPPSRSVYSSPVSPAAAIDRRATPPKEGKREMKFINIGFGNMVAADRVVTIAYPDSAPIKRIVQDAKDAGRAIDVSCGRRTRSVIITDSEHVILSAIQPETIAGRVDGGDDEDDGEE